MANFASEKLATRAPIFPAVFAMRTENISRRGWRGQPVSRAGSSPTNETPASAGVPILVDGAGRALRPELVPVVEVVEVLATGDHAAVLDLEDDAAVGVQLLAVPPRAV